MTENESDKQMALLLGACGENVQEICGVSTDDGGVPISLESCKDDTVFPGNFPEWCVADAQAIFNEEEQVWLKNPESALRLWTTGEPGQSGQHSSVMTVCQFAVRSLGLHVRGLEDRWEDLKEKLIAQYEFDDGHPHANGEYQIQSAFDKAVYDSDNGIEHSSKDIIKDEIDLGELRKYRRVSMKDIQEKSPFPEPESVTLNDFLKDMFPEDVCKGAFACLQPVQKSFGYIVDPKNYFAIDPQRHTEVPIEKQLFVSRSLFKSSDLSGRRGARTKDNLSHTPYLVLESDFHDKADAEHFAGFAMTMSEHAPLVAVVDSGGKSMHFWFAIHEVDKKVLQAFTRRAVRCGADRGVITDQTKLVRSPNVSPEGVEGQDHRRVQKLLFYNPSNAILERAEPWDLEGFEKDTTDYEKLEYYYCEGKYYSQAVNGAWISMDKVTVNQDLRILGYRPNVTDVDPNSEVDKAMYVIRQQNNLTGIVDSLGGFDAGVHQLKKGSVLVRESRSFPTLLTKSKGFPAIMAFIDDCYDGVEKDILLAWLAGSVRASYNGGAPRSRNSHAQYLNIVGEPGGGKTTLFKEIITPLMGGRNCTVKELFSSSEFNTLAYSGELGIIDDADFLYNTAESRRQQGNVIRNYVASLDKQVHPKYGKRIPVAPFGRIVRTMNPDQVNTMPFIYEDGVEDKIIILQALKRGAKKSADWFDSQKILWANEIDSFFTYLIKEHVTPEDVKDPEGRYPCVSYKNQDILSLMSEASPADRLRRVLSHDEVLPNNFEHEGSPAYRGTRTDLYEHIRDSAALAGIGDLNEFCKSPVYMCNYLREISSMDCDLKVLYSDDESNDLPKQIRFDDGKRDRYWVIVKKDQNSSGLNPETA